jgi:hypothetical protein
MKGDIFEDGDPFEDPHWKITKRKLRSGRYIGCPMSWLAWVFPLVRGKNQLLMALYLYRRCCVCSSDTVTVPNDEVGELLDLSRWAKCRALRGLEQTGIIKRIGRNGWRHATKIQLCCWPAPPSK